MAMALGEERATVYMRLVINELVTGIFTLFDSIVSFNIEKLYIY